MSHYQDLLSIRTICLFLTYAAQLSVQHLHPTNLLLVDLRTRTLTAVTSTFPYTLKKAVQPELYYIWSQPIPIDLDVKYSIWSVRPLRERARRNLLTLAPQDNSADGTAMQLIPDSPMPSRANNLHRLLYAASQISLQAQNGTQPKSVGSRRRRIPFTYLIIHTTPHINSHPNYLVHQPVRTPKLPSTLGKFN